ncbi:MAG: wax ester/triacylglycerol synthase family O-acyltransferase [Saprospiraceae bacterium]|jgi:WS/DGAT/MGAT family acyltransferase|nr:wax ester/triacylglycerol synthase family O-acyltransferase [Saprospiraceae bacterium]
MFDKILESLAKETLTPISGMDATFLYTETPTSPMNIGSVIVIEGSLDFKTFKKKVHSRIHQFPKLRQRLIYVPMSIDYPYWVDDPNFDIDLHIKHIALPKPGSWKELRKIASQIFSEPFDQNRPLWSMIFVEGLDNLPQVPPGSVAIISTIHHVAVDGVGGAGLLSLFLDFTPEKQEIPEPLPYTPAPLPNHIQLIVNSTMSFARDPFKFPKIISNTLKATIRAGVLTRMQSSELPTAPFTAPSTPLNGIISGVRKWNSAILSLQRVQQIKNVMGTTLNDVLLAICSGALRRYLLEKNKLPEKSLVSLVPISTRSKEENSADNQISAMLVQIATNVEDPIERLETIHENNNRGKNYQGAIGAKTLAGMANAIPFGIANQAARLYSRYKISEFHKPIFNVTITNVPGPQMPLYINGHKMITVMGSAPIIDGMGLIITILSYDGHITISPVSDTNSMPDLDQFTVYLRESANELEAAVIQYQKKKKKTTPKKKVIPESDTLFNSLSTFLKSLPDSGKPKSGIFQFDVNGDELSEWVVDISVYPGEVKKGRAESADATFTINETYLQRIAAGKLDVQTAFIQGRLKIDGDFDQAMRMGKILGKMLAAQKK